MQDGEDSNFCSEEMEVPFFPAAVYHVYRMSTQMGKKNSRGQEIEEKQRQRLPAKCLPN